MNRILIKLKLSTLSLIFLLTQPTFALNEGILAELENINKCESHQERIVVKYHSLSSSNIQIGRDIKEGEITGQVKMSYMGISTFGDIMIVEKLEENLGHNITLLMCPAEHNSKFGQTPIIHTDRGFLRFSITNDIVLNDNLNTCGIGSLSVTDTVLVTNSYESEYGTLSPSVVMTTFFNPEPSLDCADIGFSSN